MNTSPTGTTTALQRSSFLLEPGCIFCTQGSASVQAVLGSCVAVCLWDHNRKRGGMNHFLLPATARAELATARYGNVATVELVSMMERMGCRRQDLLAQILGGARPREARGADIGERNVKVARDILRRKGIDIYSEDVGGHMGRKVVFDTASGHVMVLKVYQLRASDWVTAY